MPNRKTIGVILMAAAAVVVALMVWQSDWKPTPVQQVVYLVILAGTLGGMVNGILTSDGLLLPQRVTVTRTDDPNPQTIWRPGFIGTSFVGAVAALLGVGTDLLKTLPLVPGIGGAAANDMSKLAPFSLGSFTTAMIFGLGGAVFLKTVMDKALWKQTAILNATAQPSGSAAVAAAGPDPVAALRSAITGNTTTNGNPTGADF